MKETTLKNGKMLVLSEAEPDDAPELLAYLNTVGGESDNLLFGGGDFTMTEEQERGFLAQMQADKGAIILLGRIDGQIVTCSQIARVSGRARTAHRAGFAISVKKEFWGMGIGAAAMEALFSFAKSAGIEVIQLEVKADNTGGIRLYEKMGFTRIGTYPKFMKINGVYHDAYLMNKYF